MEEKRFLKRQDRLHLVYRPVFGELVELPLKLLVMGDFTQRLDDVRLEDRKTINIDKGNFNEVMDHHKLSLAIQVENYLSEAQKDKLDVNLKFSSLSDFEPDSIVKQLPELKEFIKPFNGRKPTDEESDALSNQLDAILHHHDFQQLEAAWRGLKFLVYRTDFSENIKIVLLNIPKDDLFKDVEDHPENIRHSGLFRKVYMDEYPLVGGEPYGAIIANYEFEFSPQDISLLQNIARVAAMAHAPFIASASPKIFGLEDFRELYRCKGLSSIFRKPQYSKWHSFREWEDSRYIGLTFPRFLLRPAYVPGGKPVSFLNYKEDISANQHHLWGSAAFAFASRLTHSFAKYRLCWDIEGPKNGGLVEDLPIHTFEDMGANGIMGAVEVLISDRQVYELEQLGFIGLILRKENDSACFFSANSVHKPKLFERTPDGRAAESNHKYGTRLPYLFIISRFAHYIKMIYTENLGSWDRKDLQENLNKWISQYIIDYDNQPPAEICRKRPLRAAQIVVEDVEKDPYRYRFLLKVRPWPGIKFMGEYSNLSLVGILD